MLSQHFLITLNRRYVIDHQIVINLNCEAFRFDITDKSIFWGIPYLPVSMTIIQYILSGKLDDFVWYNIALSIVSYWNKRVHNGIVAII